jgi:perosamine synthetase
MIPWYKPNFWGREKDYMTEALESTWISGGEFLDRLESEMARILDVRHVVTTSNGTTSLMLSYLCLGIGPGDEVIIPGFTFAAPANMAIAVGAQPIFADIDPYTWLLCSKSVEEKVTSKTKAIVPVHIYGNVCDMDEIMRIARKYNLFVIEDVAEAAFSNYRGKQAGTFGDFGSFSFQATKTITTGEGGAVCTGSDDLQERARLIRSHGMRPARRYFHEVVGHNFRLTNLQAALGCAQLEHIDDIVANKKRVFARYQKHLANMPGVRVQAITPGCDPVMWAIAVKVSAPGSRDQLMENLKIQGIETRPGFYAFSDMPVYRAGYLPVTKDVAESVLSLPSYTMISDEDIDYICSVLSDVLPY